MTTPETDAIPPMENKRDATAVATTRGLMPADPDQALRVRRMLMALATAMMMPVILLVSAMLGTSSYLIVPWSAVAPMGLAIFFYVLIRFDFNLRFRDPSLTAEMILASIVCVAVISYWTDGARRVVDMFYLMSMMFGALRLGAARLLWLAVVALLAHGVMLLLWHSHHPDVGIKESAMEWLALAMILPWFAGMAAYVNALRARLSKSRRKLAKALDRMESIAIRDELTGLYNRRFLMDLLEREAARGQRTGSVFAVCLVDVDHFKSINDTYGHAAGDEVLRGVAATAEANKRAVDVVGRLGGEEFLVVLPETDLKGAMACAERIRHAIGECTFSVLPPERRLTVTAGIALSVRNESPSALLARADRALYAGKAAGRNRTLAA
ncbi:MAG: GGDEF domain-containing protein [Proteobacteria bacterium]|nr:GGDEF domain-containing protein [Pseudomonadota bacterium]